MIYLITNRHLIDEDRYYEVIKESVQSGIGAIILREKDLTYDELLSMAYKVKKIIGNSRVKLIINQDIEVARTVKADGIQISYDRFMNQDFDYSGLVEKIGVSVHSIEEGIQASKKGADYLLASHVFQTECKKGLEPRGVVFIQEMMRQVNVPVVGLGGILPSNIR